MGWSPSGGGRVCNWTVGALCAMLLVVVRPAVGGRWSAARADLVGGMADRHATSDGAVCVG
jgi:hypothetical protein